MLACSQSSVTLFRGKTQQPDGRSRTSEVADRQTVEYKASSGLERTALPFSS